jgi:hypothetical protein
MVKVLLAATAAVVLAAGLTGCGDKGASAASGAPSTASSTATPSASTGPVVATLPSCVAIWRTGHRLPGAYDGCRVAGRVVRAQHRQCSSGQVLESYGSRYYAVHGGPIQKVSALSRSAKYKSAIRSCDA